MTLQFPAGEVEIPDARSHTTRVNHETQLAVNSVRRGLEILSRRNPVYGEMLTREFEELVRLIAAGGRAA